MNGCSCKNVFKMWKINFWPVVDKSAFASLPIFGWVFRSVNIKIHKFSSFPATFLFYFMNTFGIISFLVLSLYWPELMRHWQTIESLPIFQNFVHKTAYIRRIRLIAAAALILASGNFSRVVSVLDSKSFILLS